MNCIESTIYQTLDSITGGKVGKHDSEKKTVFYFYTELQVIIILAFTGGFVDAAGYIKCAQLFTSSITGNLVVACSSIYHTYGVIARVCVSSGFIIAGIIGFFIASILKHNQEWKVKPVSALLYLFEVILFLITFGLGLNYDQVISEHDDSLTDWRLILTASIMGASMGMHNAAAKESIPNVPATTVMTMTLVSESMTLSQLLAFFLADHLCLRLSPKGKQITDEDRKKNHEKLIDALGKWITVTRPLIAFLIGALVGCALASNITYYSLLIPIVLIGSVVVDIYFAMVVDKMSSEYAALKAKGDEENINSGSTDLISTKETELVQTPPYSEKADQEKD
eukprot:gene10704-11662_t